MSLVGALGLGSQILTLMATVAAAASAGPGPDDALVVVEDFAFTPSTVTVVSGASVVWSVRKDPEQHTVTPVEPGAFEGSGQLFAGDDHTIRFDAAGRYEYICTFHPFMTGTVVVGAGAASPTTSTTASPTVPAMASLEPSRPGPSASAGRPIDDAAGGAAMLPIAGLILALGCGLVAVVLLRRRPR